jgi:hypothetical protein
MMAALAERLHMRFLAFVLLLAVIGTASAADSVPDCGEPGSRWLGDFHPQGGGEGPQVVLPINDRLNLEVNEEIGFSIKVRDRKTGENVFGTPPHGVEPYYLTPWEVQLRRAGKVLSTTERGNIIPLEIDAHGAMLIVDARELYSNREDPDGTSKDELFAKGVLHICSK